MCHTILIVAIVIFIMIISTKIGYIKCQSELITVGIQSLNKADHTTIPENYSQILIEHDNISEEEKKRLQGCIDTAYKIESLIQNVNLH